MKGYFLLFLLIVIVLSCIPEASSAANDTDGNAEAVVTFTGPPRVERLDEEASWSFDGM